MQRLFPELPPQHRRMVVRSRIDGQRYRRIISEARVAPTRFERIVQQTLKSLKLLLS